MKKVFLGIIAFLSLSAANLNAQALISISEVQGEKFLSDQVGKTVKVQGIITAIRSRGFYIQTPDNKIDENPKTSEGIFVFTRDEPASDIKIGNFIEVTGDVSEYRSSRSRYGLFITQISKPDIKVLSSDNPLPKAILLTKEFFNPKGNPDQLERFEGMRVKLAELEAVSPTGGRNDKETNKIVSNGDFYAVLSGTPRPFREPGLNALTVLFDKLPQTLPIFDMNPEVLRVDSDALNGASPIDVATGAKIKNLSGVMDYSFDKYTLMVDPDVKAEVEGGATIVKSSPAGEREVTVASFNLENFFDDEKNSDLKRKETRVEKEVFERRLKKASLAIRDVLSTPDIVGVIEVENLAVVQKLAKKLNADAVAAKSPDPKYEAFVEESNDPRGIDVGYLIKTSKVSVVKSEQILGEEKLEHKDARPNERLFSRPPMLIQVEVPKENGEKFAFTVIINHFKSLLGLESPKSGDRTRNKRRLQAEFLAKFVKERQEANPEEKIVVMGDFNAFQFNDGYTDLLGILKGKPERNLINPSQEIYQTGLINLVEKISPPTRYSYIFGGNAQVLDHILINRAISGHALKFGFTRSNTDFPKIFANDETRPERVSDHDAAVLYLSLDDRRKKKAEAKPTPQTEVKKEETP